jgi:hypothetical protein
MAAQDLMDGLITTYRVLNTKVRQVPEERLRAKAGDGASVRDLVSRLRDNELRFSQALKERLTGIPMPEMMGEDDAPVVGTENVDDTTPVILSQFGTARESTLAMLRGMAPTDWDQILEGGQPIATRIGQLLEHDKRQVERIDGLLGAR